MDQLGDNKFYMHIPCDILIDQNVYIGKDPVGYRCFNDAAFVNEDGILFCKHCKIKFENIPSRKRLTLPKESQYFCKGDINLGTACGICLRCTKVDKV